MRPGSSRYGRRYVTLPCDRRRWYRSHLALWLLALIAVSAGWAGGDLAAGEADRNASPVTLTAHAADAPPTLDGEPESIWLRAPVSLIPLYRGRRGAQVALELQMRALYTAESVYFFARWPDSEPVLDAWGERNRLILHFGVAAPWDGAADTMCLTSCHTAYVGQDNLARYITAETIPPGLSGPMPLGGGWHDGFWTFEWGRPLVSGNPFDVQFDDLSESHEFFCKVIEAVPGQADPVSDDLLLAFDHAR